MLPQTHLVEIFGLLRDRHKDRWSFDTEMWYSWEMTT